MGLALFSVVFFCLMAWALIGLLILLTSIFERGNKK